MVCKFGAGSYLETLPVAAIMPKTMRPIMQRQANMKSKISVKKAANCARPGANL